MITWPEEADLLKLDLKNYLFCFSYSTQHSANQK